MMLVYGRFSLFLENVAVSSRAFISRSGLTIFEPVDLYLRTLYLIRFGHFVNRDCAVLLKEVEDWLRNVNLSRSI